MFSDVNNLRCILFLNRESFSLLRESLNPGHVWTMLHSQVGSGACVCRRGVGDDCVFQAHVGGAAVLVFLAAI